MKPSLRRISQSVSSFIEKAYQILDQPENDSIIDWSSSGQSFIIKDVKSFEREILPKYFKHSNFTSFVRQLNMYNFHKVRGEKHENQFEHERFRKGHRQLLCKVKRKQSQLLIASMGFIDGAANLQVVAAESPQKGISQYDFKDEQHGKPNSENDHLKVMLEGLQEQNSLLRKGKLKQQLALKELNVVSGTLVAEKFYKLVACLLAEKVKNQLNIDSDLNEKVLLNGESKGFTSPVLNFDELIEHVVGGDDPLDFRRYRESARTLMKRHTDQVFMLQKSRKQAHTQ